MTISLPGWCAFLLKLAAVYFGVVAVWWIIVVGFIGLLMVRAFRVWRW